MKTLVAAFDQWSGCDYSVWTTFLQLSALSVKWLLNPALVAVVGLVALAPRLAVPIEQWRLGLSLYLALGLGLTLAVLVALRCCGVVSDLMLLRPNERPILYLAMICSGIVAVACLATVSSPPQLIRLAALQPIGGAMLVAPLLIRRWRLFKSSMHVFTCTVITLTLYQYGGLSLPSVILAIAFVGWGRYYLQEHSVEQILAGGASGVLAVFASTIL